MAKRTNLKITSSPVISLSCSGSPSEPLFLGSSSSGKRGCPSCLTSTNFLGPLLCCRSHRKSPKYRFTISAPRFSSLVAIRICSLATLQSDPRIFTQQPTDATATADSPRSHLNLSTRKQAARRGVQKDAAQPHARRTMAPSISARTHGAHTPAATTQNQPARVSGPQQQLNGCACL